MKSLVEEASSISKAIEKAWSRAGKPINFSIKIFEEPVTNFFGFTKKNAKIGIFYEEAKPEYNQNPNFNKNKPQRFNRENESKEFKPKVETVDSKPIFNKKPRLEPSEFNGPKPQNNNPNRNNKKFGNREDRPFKKDDFKKDDSVNSNELKVQSEQVIQKSQPVIKTDEPQAFQRRVLKVSSRRYEAKKPSENSTLNSESTFDSNKE